MRAMMQAGIRRAIDTSPNIHAIFDPNTRWMGGVVQPKLPVKPVSLTAGEHIIPNKEDMK